MYTQNPFYFSKSKKDDAWKLVSKNFDKETAIVKKKMSSFLGSFRAQMSISRKTTGTGEISMF